MSNVGPGRDQSLEYRVRALEEACEKLFETKESAKSTTKQTTFSKELFGFLRWLVEILQPKIIPALQISGGVILAALFITSVFSCGEGLVIEARGQCERACSGMNLQYVAYSTSGAAGDGTADYCTCSGNGTVSMYNLRTGAVQASQATSLTPPTKQ